jgi:hypothetical protein
MLDIKHPTKFNKPLGDRVLAYEYFDEKAGRSVIDDKSVGRSVIDDKLVHRNPSSKDYTPPVVDLYGPEDDLRFGTPAPLYGMEIGFQSTRSPGRERTAWHINYNRRRCSHYRRNILTPH